MRTLAAVFIAASLLLSGAEPAGDSQPSGFHGLRNKRYQLFLRPRDASNKDGTPIVLYPQYPWKWMAWKFENVQGRVRLVNFLTGKTFQMQVAAGNPVVQKPVAADTDVQTWKFVPLEGGLFKLESVTGPGAMTAAEPEGSGDVRIVVRPWSNLDSQKWELVPLPDHFTA